MTEKPDKHPLSIRPPKGVAATGQALNPMTLIPGSRLSDAIKHGGRIYQLMVDSVRDYAIFMLDTTGHVASWNKGAHRIKRYTAEEIIGRHFSTFYTAEDIATDKPGLELKVAARQGRFEDEGPRVRKDGSMFWANVIITAVRNEDGTLIGFAKVTRDLTERRAAEDRAIADARRLARVEAAAPRANSWRRCPTSFALLSMRSADMPSY